MSKHTRSCLRFLRGRMIHVDFFRRLLWLTAVLLLLVATTPGATAQTEEEDPLRRQAQALLDRMTVAERVGQLFLVTFRGDAAPEDGDVADLILNYRVGGVMLLAENDNITGYGDPAEVPRQLAELTNDLQRLALLGMSVAAADSDLPPNLDEDAVPPTRLPTPPNTAVPLLIATSQEGDGSPFSQIFNGLTPLPNNMAIGATWQPANAQTVGQIAGRELSALGINMLFGPALDVLENPTPLGANQLGTRTFGGDPYWVGLMGRAYTTGVHLGSNGRIAVVPKHFPGYGSSDRLLHEEIPTVRKSLEQLKQIELAPFFTVTGSDVDQAETADALLTTHIRYQGFQGNIRATTNPVSFDQSAMATLLNQPQLAPWRQSGGLIISDALGVRAVERFYDDTGTEFPHRQVAKDAFLAGNDMLTLSDFALGDGDYAQHLANVKDTISWFQERYETDPSFRQQVDQSVLRILQLKLRLYGEDVSPSNVIVDTQVAATTVGRDSADIFDVAQAGVTLISPSLTDLMERLPQPPGPNENIVIFTDVRQAQQCSQCPPQPLISETAIADRMLAVYGPDASGQVQPAQIESFSFANLQTFLDAGPGPILPPAPPPTATAVLPPPDSTPTAENAPTPTPSPTPSPPPEFLVQEALGDADWIIFGMLDTISGPQALTNFLAQRPDLVRSKQVIVFAFNAPYYLDTTQISQLTAYFGVYSKTGPYIDAAVRTLFQELALTGAPPVNVDGIRYNLFTQTQPDPDQVIDLFVVDENGLPLTNDNEPLDVSVGDTLRLQTDVILDRNGHPVPDNTVVRYIQRDRVEGIVNIIAEVPTRNGVAQLDYVLEARTEAGQFQITAEAGDAVVSLEVNISVGATEGGARVSISTPVPPPTSTPTPESTDTPTPSPSPTPTAVPTETPAAPTTALPAEPTLQITLQEIQMLAALGIGLGLVGGLGMLLVQRVRVSPSQQVGLLLWGVVGALVVYIYFALSLPGTAVLAELGSWAALLTTLLGGGLGLLLYRLRLART